MRRSITGFFLLLSIAATAQITAAGKFIDTVTCNRDNHFSYALYLPSDYSDKAEWPVIFLFDPAARGTVAVNVWKDAAEKYGYILAGSNNSRNGPMQNNVDAADAMMHDVLSKYAIDKNRIYTGGFSGGARMAGLAAMIYKNFAGVIACGAGLPDLGDKYHLDSSIVYAATTGVEDMNYSELRDVKAKLIAQRNAVRIFDFAGTHQWPPSATANACIEWIRLQAMKRKLQPVDEAWVDAYYRNELDTAKQWMASGKNYDAYVLLSDMQKDFTDIHTTNEAASLYQSLQQDKSAMKDISDAEEDLAKEKKEITDYITEIWRAGNGEAVAYVQPADWWKSSGDELRKQMKNKDLRKAAMAVRIFNMISLNCEEMGMNDLKNNDAFHALHFFSVWTWVDPESSEAWLDLACSQSMHNDNQLALDSLEKSKKNGLTKGMLDNYVFFLKNINDSKEYKKITGELPEKELK